MFRFTVLNSDLSNIATYKSAVAGSKTLSTTLADINSIILSKGTYLILGNVYFSANVTNGTRREVHLSKTSSSFTGLGMVIDTFEYRWMQIKGFNVITLSSDTTVYMVARSTAGSSDSIQNSIIEAIRLNV